MASKVQSPRNHYETLGLMPAATDEEIKEAFKNKISLFQTNPVGTAAQVCMAYETLRDPVKRQAHDRSLGLIPERPREPAFVLAQQRWAPVIASPRFNPSLEREGGTAAHAERCAVANGYAKADVHPKVAAIAASLQELARLASPETPSDSVRPPAKPERQVPASARVANVASQAELDQFAAPPGLPNSTQEAVHKRPVQRPHDVPLEDLVRQIRETGRAERDASNKAGGRSLNWKQPAVAFGSLLLGAAAFGTIAGLSVKGDEAPAKAETASTLPRAARHHVKVAATSLAATPTEIASAPTMRTHIEPHRSKRALSRVQSGSLLEQQAPPALPPDESDAVNDASDQPATEPAKAGAAALPLPNEVVARTIERIGYSCGKIASTTADGDAPGVFTVACTSGQSYQATPVRGRYHFRRLASR